LSSWTATVYLNKFSKWRTQYNIIIGRDALRNHRRRLMNTSWVELSRFVWKTGHFSFSTIVVCEYISEYGDTGIRSSLEEYKSHAQKPNREITCIQHDVVINCNNIIHYILLYRYYVCSVRGRTCMCGHRCCSRPIPVR
jgi:hypothetical protein